jgi:integrase
MATLFKRKGSRNWQIRYFKDGKEHFISTRTATRRVAENKLAHLQVKLDEGWYKKPSKTDIDQALDSYLDYHRAKTCPDPDKPRKSYKNVESRINLFRKWLKDSHASVRHVEQLSTETILSYLTMKRNEDRVSPKTYNHYRQVISTFFSYLIKKHGYCGNNPSFPNPVSKIEKMREQCSQITFLTLTQIHLQLEGLSPNNLKALAAKNPWLEEVHMGIKQYKPWIFEVMKPMVAVLLYAGLRREELLWLTSTDVDLDRQMLYIRSKTVAGEFWEPKTKRNRCVPISKALLKQLSAYKPPSKSLWFFPFSGGNRWNPDNFSKALREFNRAAGLVWKNTDTQAGKRVGMPWSSLDYRHTFGSQLAMKGETLHKLSELLGNSPEICRRHYAHLMPESLRACVEFDDEVQGDEGLD